MNIQTKEKAETISAQGARGRALITGVTGQDVSYLAELMLEKGYSVVGTVRDKGAAVDKLPAGLAGNIELVEWDMLDQRILQEILSCHRPVEIYNLAAYSSGSGMYDDPIGIGEVNGQAVVRILEAIRAVDERIRFCQASSREIFGEAQESPQNERTPVNPRSPYGAAKLYADAMIRIYRQRYGLFACSAILFNHESPRRGMGFVTRKISNGAARIKLGQARELKLGNLDAVRDWGFAGDTVRAMWLQLQQQQAEEYVVATGEPHTVREFCDCAFRHLGLDYREYVREDAASLRPEGASILVGDPSKARAMLGWAPTVGFEELVQMMVDADMQRLTGNKQQPGG